MPKFQDPTMQLLAIVAIVSAMIIILTILFLNLKCNKERYEVLNQIPTIKNIFPKTKHCDMDNFSVVYMNKSPNSGFERMYKIKSAEFPASAENACPCFDWCYQNDNCEGFTYTPNIKPNANRCDFMSKEIAEFDLRPQKNSTYFQKTQRQSSRV
jgi:hypothetical protein